MEGADYADSDSTKESKKMCHIICNLKRKIKYILLKSVRSYKTSGNLEWVTGKNAVNLGQECRKAQI